MKTYIKHLLAVSVLLAIAFIGSGTVSANEQPIWSNFVTETTLSGTAPSEARMTDTARIWQTQVEAFQKADPLEQADRQTSNNALALTTPIWGEQCKCL